MTAVTSAAHSPYRLPDTANLYSRFLEAIGLWLLRKAQNPGRAADRPNNFLEYQNTRDLQARRWQAERRLHLLIGPR